jgi:hypothetical protein
MLLSRLPPALENAEALIARRAKAAQKKEQWRSTYTEAFQYAMPTRETFTWQSEGQRKQSLLYDSTLMESTYTAANTLTALLFPAWMRWAQLAPGGAIPKDSLTPQIIDGSAAGHPDAVLVPEHVELRHGDRRVRARPHGRHVRA